LRADFDIGRLRHRLVSASRGYGMQCGQRM
jgi:hypothetical protein